MQLMLKMTIKKKLRGKRFMAKRAMLDGLEKFCLLKLNKIPLKPKQSEK